MTIDAKNTHKFSKTWIENFKKYTRFDGKDGAPNACNIKDSHGSSHGLWLRLSIGGVMTYYILGVIKNGLNNNQSTYTIGDARILDLNDAREKARLFKKYLADGLDPVATYERRGDINTLTSVFELYTQTKTLHADTINSYRMQLAYLSSYLIKKRIEDITSDDIINEHNRLKTDVSPAMADKIIVGLSKYFNFGIAMLKKSNSKEQLITFNPVHTINAMGGWFVNGGRSRRVRTCIDTQDLNSLINAIDDIEYENDHRYSENELTQGRQSFSAIIASHLFKFLLFTGWRPEETVKIEWSQVSDDCKDITWDDEKALEKLKFAEEKYRFPLNSYATEVLLSLKEYKFESKWVFPNKSLNNHFKQNPTDYINLLEAKTEQRYSLGIYRKTFQTYAEHLDILSSTIKRLVFHTQAHYDIQSGYIALNRESLRKRSQQVANYIMKEAGLMSEEAYSEKQLSESQTSNIFEAAENFNVEPEQLISQLIKLAELVKNFKDETQIKELKKQVNLNW